jgi:plastocyanin
MLKLTTFGVLVLTLFVAGLAHCAELRATVKDQRGNPVADAVVLAMPADRRDLSKAKPPSDIVDQVDKQFVPYVKPVYVGSRVSFPNKDNIRHQVYSFSPAKKFELPLYAGTAAAPVLFDTPGVVVLGCNIHDWMIGYIYVSDTPFFGKTAGLGTAAITGLPPGDYAVRIWHPNMVDSEESTARQVTVTDAGPAGLEWRIALKPAFHVPRVPAAANPGYR